MNPLVPSRAPTAALAAAVLAAAACAPAEVAPPDAPRSAASAPTTRATAAPSPAELGEPRTEPLSNPACTLRAGHGSLVSSLVLRFHGRPFAYISGEMNRSELRLAAGKGGGTADVSAAGYDLIGEILLKGVPLRTLRTTMVDDWIGVDEPRVKEVVSSGLAIDVVLPDYVTATKLPSLTLSCADVTTTRREHANPSEGKETIAVSETRLPLRAAPGGALLGELVVPPAEKGSNELEITWVTVLGRKGGSAQIRLDGNGSWVVAWVEDKKLRAVGGLIGGVVGGLGLSGEAKAATYRCPTDVPLYVRDAGSVVRVGTAKAGTPLTLRSGKRRRGDDGLMPGEVGVDLTSIGGLGFPFDVLPNEKGLVPFVRKAVFDACVPE
jgi:hypothetical protein